MKRVLKVLICLFIFIIIMCSIILIRRAVIINKLTKISEETMSKYNDNYQMIFYAQSFDFSTFTIRERKVFDGEQIDSDISISKENGKIKTYTEYNFKSDKIITIESDSSKVFSYKDNLSIENLNVYKGEVKDILKTSVRKILLDDKLVYVINNGDFEYYVSVENGLIIKCIDLLNNITHDYEYVLGEVSSEDMKLPDLTEYDLIEN